MGLWLRFILRRGSDGVGIDVDENNILVRMAPRGVAAADGLCRVGDVFSMVDGMSVEGAGGLTACLAPGKQDYQVTVYRDGLSDWDLLATRLSASHLGPGTSGSPLSLMRVVVRRADSWQLGISGSLGLVIVDHFIVGQLVSQGQAEIDGILRPGDCVAAVDGRFAIPI